MSEPAKCEPTLENWRSEALRLRDALDRVKGERDALVREKDAGEFWRECFKDGADSDDIRKELTDFRFVMQEVPKVYDHISGGMLSKVNYYADEVIGRAEEIVDERIAEAVDPIREIMHLGEDDDIYIKVDDLLARAESAESQYAAEQEARKQGQAYQLELMARCRELEGERDLKGAMLKASVEGLARLTDRCRELEGALKFYADPESWKEPIVKGVKQTYRMETPIHGDGGDLARRALGGK